MIFTDSHAHLCLPAFDADRQDVLQRARDAGMRHLLCIGSLARDAQASQALAEGNSDIFFTVGLHPHDARLWSDELAHRLESFLTHPRLLAIGEIGLDYHYNYSPPEAQREAFRAQIRLACAHHLPIVIHTREAHDDTLAILEAEAGAAVGGVFHCFSGNREMADFAWRSHFRISFSGTLTFKNAGPLREIAAGAPAAALLTETDAPFLSPHPHRGRRNEPARVADVVRCLAEARGTSAEEMGELTTRNFVDAFPRLASV